MNRPAHLQPPDGAPDGMPSSSYRSMVIAAGVVGVLSGLALLLFPYSLAIGDGTVTRACSAPVVGVVSGSDAVPVDPDVRSGCPSSARTRAALGVAFMGGGVGAVVLIVGRTRRPPLLVNGPVPPSWEATGGPPPV